MIKERLRGVQQVSGPVEAGRRRPLDATLGGTGSHVALLLTTARRAPVVPVNVAVAALAAGLLGPEGCGNPAVVTLWTMVNAVTFAMPHGHLPGAAAFAKACTLCTVACLIAVLIKRSPGGARVAALAQPSGRRLGVGTPAVAACPGGRAADAGGDRHLPDGSALHTILPLGGMQVTFGSFPPRLALEPGGIGRLRDRLRRTR